MLEDVGERTVEKSWGEIICRQKSEASMREKEKKGHQNKTRLIQRWDKKGGRSRGIDFECRNLAKSKS